MKNMHEIDAAILNKTPRTADADLQILESALWVTLPQLITIHPDIANMAWALLGSVQDCINCHN